MEELVNLTKSGPRAVTRNVPIPSQRTLSGHTLIKSHPFSVYSLIVQLVCSSVPLKPDPKSDWQGIRETPVTLAYNSVHGGENIKDQGPVGGGTRL